MNQGQTYKNLTEFRK